MLQINIHLAIQTACDGPATGSFCKRHVWARGRNGTNLNPKNAAKKHREVYSFILWQDSSLPVTVMNIKCIDLWHWGIPRLKKKNLLRIQVYVTDRGKYLAARYISNWILPFSSLGRMYKWHRARITIRPHQWHSGINSWLLTNNKVCRQTLVFPVIRAYPRCGVAPLPGLWTMSWHCCLEGDSGISNSSSSRSLSDPHLTPTTAAAASSAALLLGPLCPCVEPAKRTANRCEGEKKRRREKKKINKCNLPVGAKGEGGPRIHWKSCGRGQFCHEGGSLYPGCFL